eukprot:gb/GEZN01001927.1/.p1 GENE.gb/GEZN01001927.1/~~gb/GEZN01001927.1/.p1  ORF type:complete len:825 (-),score=51.24 gb/GEZN01001927.1/:268-2703(-)
MLARRLCEATGMAVSITSVFQYPTIKELAAALELLAQGGLPTYFTSFKWSRTGEPLSSFAFGTVQAFAIVWIVMVALAPFLAAISAFIYILNNLPLYFAMLALPCILLGVALISAVLVYSSKWALVGRLRPGVYPLYSPTFLRWWFNRRLMDLPHLWLWIFNETPWLASWYRLLGATIGPDAHWDQVVMQEPDLVLVGTGSMASFESAFCTSEVVAGSLVLRQVHLGDRVQLGVRAVILPGATVPADCQFAASTTVGSNTVMQPQQLWAGSPAKLVGQAPPSQQLLPAFVRRDTYHYAQFLGIFLLMYLIQWPFIATAEIAFALYDSYPEIGFSVVSGYMATSAILVASLGYFLMLLAAKWILIGRIVPGRTYNGPWFFLRRWFIDRLMLNSLFTRFQLVLLDNSSTCPWFFRLLGVKIGAYPWISPPLVRVGSDLVTFGQHPHVGHFNVFFTDVVSLHGVQFYPITVGDHTTVGQQAVLGAGATVSSHCTIGAATCLPRDYSVSVRSTVCGSPPVCFQSHVSSEEQTKLLQQQVSASRGQLMTESEEKQGLASASSNQQRHEIGWARSWCFALGCIACQLGIPVLMSVVWTYIYQGWYFNVLRPAWPTEEQSLPSTQYKCLSSAIPLTLVSMLICCFALITLLHLVGAFNFKSGRTTFFSVNFFLWHIFSEQLYAWTSRVMSWFGGTKLYNAWLRLMGAQIAPRVFIDPGSGGFRELNHLDVKQGAVVLTDTIHAHYIDHQMLQFAPVIISDGVCLNFGALVMPMSSFQSGAVLRPFACTVKGQVFSQGSVHSGNPASSCYLLNAHALGS